MKVSPKQLRPGSETERTLHRMASTQRNCFRAKTEDVTVQLRHVEDLTDEREMPVEPEFWSPDDELDEEEPEPVVSLPAAGRLPVALPPVTPEDPACCHKPTRLFQASVDNQLR